MLRRTRLRILCTLSLVGVSIAGYAYAASCGPPPPAEVLDMEFLSVEYDGVLQIDPPQYRQVSGWMEYYRQGEFRMEVDQQGATSVTLVTGDFRAE